MISGEVVGWWGGGLECWRGKRWNDEMRTVEDRKGRWELVVLALLRRSDFDLCLDTRCACDALHSLIAPPLSNSMKSALDGDLAVW